MPEEQLSTMYRSERNASVARGNREGEAPPEPKDKECEAPPERLLAQTELRPPKHGSDGASLSRNMARTEIRTPVASLAYYRVNGFEPCKPARNSALALGAPARCVAS